MPAEFWRQVLDNSSYSQSEEIEATTKANSYLPGPTHTSPPNNVPAFSHLTEPRQQQRGEADPGDTKIKHRPTSLHSFPSNSAAIT